MSIATLLTLLLLITLVVFAYRYALTLLRNRIVEARGGILSPVPLPSVMPPFTRSLIDDYNVTIQNFGTIFRTVEECQARVLRERNKIDSILQSLPGVLFTVSNDLNINLANRFAEETFAFREQPLIGTNLFELIRFDEHDRDVLRDSFLYKRPLSNQEIRLTINDEERWFSLNLSFFNNIESEMEATITMLDISENRQLQETITSHEKLVAMGQLAGGVAHELNTPLGNILGYIQLIKADLPPDQKAAEYASVVENETRRCSNIIHDLLSFAHNEKCSGETSDINPLLRTLLDNFISCRTRRYGIAMELDLETSLPPVEGDSGQLEIVFTNLIINAVQALDGTETPTIWLRSRQRDNEFVEVMVEDNGPGIGKEIRRDIFNPFFTTKEVGKGSGLGLSISQALLAKRGAYIRYDPDYTQGARFIVGLPTVDPKRRIQ